MKLPMNSRWACTGGYLAIWIRASLDIKCIIVMIARKVEQREVRCTDGGECGITKLYSIAWLASGCRIETLERNYDASDMIFHLMREKLECQTHTTILYRSQEPRVYLSADWWMEWTVLWTAHDDVCFILLCFGFLIFIKPRRPLLLWGRRRNSSVVSWLLCGSLHCSVALLNILIKCRDWHFDIRKIQRSRGRGATEDYALGWACHSFNSPVWEDILIITWMSLVET